MTATNAFATLTSGLIIRTADEANAHIDSVNAEAQASGTPADGGFLNLLSLEVKAANAAAKFAKAAAEFEAQSAVRNIKVGDTITFSYGRAATKAVLTGNVIAVAPGKTGIQFNVLTGEGIDTRTVLIGADAVLLSPEAVEEVEAEIAKAKQEAADKAAKEAEGKSE